MTNIFNSDIINFKEQSINMVSKNLMLKVCLHLNYV